MQKHPNVEWIEIDITDDSALEALVADLYLRYGKIDVLINNAGYGILKISTRFLIKNILDVWGQYLCPDESVSSSWSPA